MARNDDAAARRRAKRRERLGEDAVPESGTPADEAAASISPATGDDEQAEPALVGDGDLTEAQRAEIETRAGIVGAPIDFAQPTEGTALTDFDPPAGGVVVGTEPPKGGPRLMRFFRASWAELQRVRWPDRQQVAQGTAVTLGFVVIAGAFLGVADLVARQIVNLIL